MTAQYDSVADSPTRYGFYSAMNIAFSRGTSRYFEDDDINDPDNLVYTEGNTTYMLIKADTLPMLKWVEPFVSEKRLAELDARYRPLVETRLRPSRRTSLRVRAPTGATGTRRRAVPELGARKRRAPVDAIDKRRRADFRFRRSRARPAASSTPQELRAGRRRARSTSAVEAAMMRSPSTDDDTDSVAAMNPSATAEPASRDRASGTRAPTATPTAEAYESADAA